MAGLISADGYIDEKNHRVSLRMTEPAKEVLEKLRDYFSVSNEVAMYKGKGFKGELEMYDLTISSKTLLEKLRELNIHGRKKDLLVRFPDMSLLDDDCREMYMRGLWDGDGTIRSNGVSSIFQQSKLMIDAIIEFISSLNITNDIKCYERYRDGYLIGYEISFRSHYFYDWLYRSNLDFKIESKYLRQFG